MTENKRKKPTYDAPKVMPLGELAKGEGQSCWSGGSASLCRTGSTASNNCRRGIIAQAGCRRGDTIT